MSRPFCSARWQTFSRCLSKCCSVRRFCSGTSGFSSTCSSCSRLLAEGTSIHEWHQRERVGHQAWQTLWAVCSLSSVTFFTRCSFGLHGWVKSSTYLILAALLPEGLYKQREGWWGQEVPAGTEWEPPRGHECPTVPRPTPAALHKDKWPGSSWCTLYTWPVTARYTLDLIRYIPFKQSYRNMLATKSPVNIIKPLTTVYFAVPLQVVFFNSIYRGNQKAEMLRI